MAGLAGLGAVAAVVGIWHLPARMYPGTSDGAVQARAALQGGLLTAAAALVAVAGGLIALNETRRANAEMRRANDNTHVRELYATAISQLGADNLDVRLGGIYALERIAVNSPDDHRTVVEVLSAFVREHTRPPRPPAARRAPPGRRWNRTSLSGAAQARPWLEEAPATDVQAAVTVLGRLPARKGVPRVDLRDANLVGANLVDANLAYASLGGANLTGAKLRTDLSHAWLAGTDFTRARLATADLTGAEMYGAILVNAWISRAVLRQAGLIGADLSGALLHEADLSGASLFQASLRRASLVEADLTGATLEAADLAGATLYGANLTDAQGLIGEQLAEALGDARTRLPQGVARPSSWPPYDPTAQPNRRALAEPWRPYDEE